MSLEVSFEEAAGMIGLFGAVLNSKLKGKELNKIGSNPKAVKARRKKNKNKKHIGNEQNRIIALPIMLYWG